jgi:hypothetical protein
MTLAGVPDYGVSEDRYLYETERAWGEMADSGSLIGWKTGTGG